MLITYYILIVLTVLGYSLASSVDITRGVQDTFKKPDGRTGVTNCESLKASCMDPDCEQCRCTGKYHTFVKIMRKYGRCLDDNQLIDIAMYTESPFVVQEIATGWCLDVYINKTSGVNTLVSISCKKNDNKQRWLWTRQRQLKNIATGECVTEETNTTKNHLRLVKCDSERPGQQWSCMGKQFRQNHSQNYMIASSTENSVVISYSEKTYTRSNYYYSYNRWRRLESNEPICSRECSRYEDGRAMVVLNGSGCVLPSKQCTTQHVEISPMMSMKLDHCCILPEQTQHLEQGSWNKTTLTNDIFKVFTQNGKIYLKWNFTKTSASQWSNTVLRLQYACAKQKAEMTKDFDVNEKSCLFVKILEMNKKRENFSTTNTTHKPPPLQDQETMIIAIVVSVPLVSIIAVTIIAFVIHRRRKGSSKQSKSNTDKKYESPLTIEESMESDNPLYNQGTHQATTTTGDQAAVCTLYEPSGNNVYQYIDTHPSPHPPPTNNNTYDYAINDASTTTNNQPHPSTYDYVLNDAPTRLARQWEYDQRHSRLSENNGDINTETRESVSKQAVSSDEKGQTNNSNDELPVTQTSPKYYVLE